MARRTSEFLSPPLPIDAGMIVLYGPDEMVKRLRLDQLREALEMVHGPIEPQKFDGRVVGLSGILDELREYALMQSYKLVVVDEAEHFVKSNRAALERYACQPVDHATLILRARTWHKGNLDKLIAKVGAVVKCEPPAPAQAQAWLIQRAKAKLQRALEPAAARLLIDRLGLDLSRLANELEKIALMVKADQLINRKLVEQVVGQSSDEQAWVVQEAVLAALVQGSPARAIEKIHELVGLAGQAEVLVTFFVADLFRKLHVGTLMRRQGVHDKQIAQHLRLWGPKVQLFTSALDRLDSARAGELFQRALIADERAKSGLGRPVRNLECFCAVLVDERQWTHSL